jgi:N utilization substance protein A
MATKKKSRKNQSEKKPVPKKKPSKKAAPKKTTLKKAAVRAKSSSKKAAGLKALAKPLSKSVARAKTARTPRKRVRGKSEIVDTVTFEPAGLGARSAGQSGDLQGLSNAGRANAESVDELLEEGNSFEAEAVKGVEDAGDADEGEVHTHEVPEDDVPGEYLDKD